MSQEFERIVLEKLNNIEGTLNEHTGILNEHTEVLNEHTDILNEHTKTLNEHTEQFKKVRKDIYDANNKIIKIGTYLKEMDLVIEYNTESIKKYNKENAKRIDLSLKAYEQLDSKLNMSKHLINAIKSNNYENELRISALEDQIKSISNIA